MVGSPFYRISKFRQLSLFNYAFDYKNLIELHIHQKQRINDYTELLGLSRVSLNKAVKEQFNVTASQLLKQRLLVEIKDYLIHSALTIAEIAYKLNFSEPNHLMRFFKKADWVDDYKISGRLSKWYSVLLIG